MSCTTPSRNKGKQLISKKMQGLQQETLEPSSQSETDSTAKGTVENTNPACVDDFERVGVGPWPGGREHWPKGDQWDTTLLAEGDRRNVTDEYRYWSREAIKKDLDRTRFSYHVAIENLDHDFNIGSIVRTANAFAARACHIVGRRRWNRRGAMVTDRYQHVDHFYTPEQFVEYAHNNNLVIIGIDNVEGSLPLEHYELPQQCVLVFGSEARGLSQEMRDACKDICHITQYGSTRSINVGHAAAIAMWAWVLRHA
ncbi:MAG: TrmH family RNA methyltransferase [Actinomycetaceae bacterium]|nr:TrmH family RNA methyltransferase [Actinomycetaceae bacterium]